MNPFVKYLENMMKYLEYLEYPSLVTYFRVEDVAETLYRAGRDFYVAGVSYRMAAIMCVSLTYEYQLRVKKTELVH